MSSCSEILVLVANEDNAVLYANNDGVSRLLRKIERVSPVTMAGDEFGADAGHIFACELMMALGRHVREQLCDGVIIFAEAPVMEALRRAQTSTVAKLLLAQVVGKIAETCCFSGLAATNAPLGYHGVVQ